MSPMAGPVVAPPAPPRIVAVVAGSAGEQAGLQIGDELVAINGEIPRDVLEYQQLIDEADLVIEVSRGGLELTVEVVKRDGEPLGVEVHTPLFDQVRTCDNHCEFCFIYQLPKGLRPSLYVKDDDYRLSFLYGNFTTLTRFTEADLERVITERLSPLHVSIHATNPEVRAEMLRNRRGATSLRWLDQLLAHGIEVHGQLVVCPGVNDADVLDDTLAGILDRFAQLASVCVVPLGISRFNNEGRMRQHSPLEAQGVVDMVESWQETYLEVLGRRVLYLADEYYLMADRPFPEASAYDGFPMHEDGVGMARAFEADFGPVEGRLDPATATAAAVSPNGVHAPQTGFFAWVDGAPADGYRAPRTVGASGASGGGAAVALRPRSGAPVAVLTGRYGARVVGPLVAALGRPDVRIVTIDNEFFGGNTAVTGLMVGADVARVLAQQPEGHRYLLPDVCLQRDTFLDGMRVDELPRAVEIVPTDGAALRAALERGWQR
jgi:putative radical SAM enzyme (TIGR03279 family)